MRGAREAPAPRDSLNFRRASLLSRNEFESGTFTIVLHVTSSFTYVSVIYGVNFSFKGALSRYSVFLSRFFAVENGGEETRVAGIGCTFFFTCSRASRLIDVGVLVSCPCKVIPLSLGRSWALRYDQESEKTSLPINNGEKFHGIQNRLAELHGSILTCLGSTIIQDSRSFRCSCVYFATQYNKHYGNRQARRSLSALRWKDTQPPLFFPTTKWHKTHWIVWQCTFKCSKYQKPRED